MNIGKAFSYVFDDPKWVSKVVLGGIFVALSLLLIGIPFLLGYIIAIIRNVASGRENPLPEWDNLGNLFVDGLKYLVIMFIYMLPIFAYQVLNFVINLSTALRSDYSGNGFGAQSMETLPTESSWLAPLLASVGCLIFIYQLILQFVMPVIAGKFATTGNIVEAFKIGEILNLVGKNFVNLILIFVLNLVTSIIGLAGIIACFVGILFTGFYALTVDSHLWGQLFVAAPAPEIPQEPVKVVPEGQG